MVRQETFRFGEFILAVHERRLVAGGHLVRLSPKAFDVLVALVRDADHLVTKHELLARVWPESFVEEGILTVHISALRKALGDDARPSAYIETVAGSGYRFVAAVTRPGTDDEEARPPGVTRPVELYQFVGRGRSHLLSGSYAELPSAEEAFRAAIEIDPTYAPAHAGLARVRCAQGTLRAAPHQEAFAEAKASALRALAMNSASADAQVALGTVLFFSEWDWMAAERSLRRALEIDPDHSEALLQFGSLHEALGRLDDGLRQKQQALARDPRSALVLVQIAMSYWHQRKYAETLLWAERALAVDPKHHMAGELIWNAYLKLGDVTSAVADFRRRALLSDLPEEALASLYEVVTRLEDVYATAGLTGVERFMADEITNVRLDFDAILKMAFRRATLYAAAGRLDEAFECLDQAIAIRDPGLVHLAVAPQWDPMRSDRRFSHRLQTMGLPQASGSNTLARGSSLA